MRWLVIPCHEMTTARGNPGAIDDRMWVIQLRGRTTVAIEGGTQALPRTIKARLKIAAKLTTTARPTDRLGCGS